ncbi:MAG: DUF1501 domain-containing protein [Alphaproteobacteria bacterium]|nr:DUF1501 domain-containing protein [Alphaproteobacteria bacterium]
MLNRRHFITACCAGLIATTSPLRFALGNTPDDRRFVFVILRGAMDGLAAVPPLGDRAYAAARRELALDDSKALPLDGYFYLHPALQPLLPLYQKKQLAIIHAVASPYRSRSHFDAQDVLENGSAGSAKSADNGWLGRALALFPQDKGLAISPALPLVMHGAGNAASWFPKKLAVDGKSDFLATMQQLYSHDTVFQPYLQQALAAEATAVASLSPEDMKSGGNAADSNVFPSLVRSCATFMAQPGGPRIAVLESGGWDTHARQGAADGTLARKFTSLADGLALFPSLLGEAAWKKTVVVVATEFGRTVNVNGTGGTDHGTASVSFLLGGDIAGGQVLADWPGLGSNQLFEGRDLAPTTDLRSVFKTVLHRQLGIDKQRLDNAIFPESAQAGLLTKLL